MNIKVHGEVRRYADGTVQLLPALNLIYRHNQDYSLTGVLTFAKWDVSGTLVVKPNA